MRVKRYANQFLGSLASARLAAKAQLAVLSEYPWPGNIRKLQNFIERSVILSTDVVLQPPLEELDRGKMPARPRKQTLVEAEREHILPTLRETEWVIGGPHGASMMLGVKRTTHSLIKCGGSGFPGLADMSARKLFEMLRF